MIQGPPSPLAWIALDNPGEVIPLNDIRQHIPGMRCWCRPEVDETMITVHNALDRREDYLEGLRRPS